MFHHKGDFEDSDLSSRRYHIIHSENLGLILSESHGSLEVTGSKDFSPAANRNCCSKSLTMLCHFLRRLWRLRAVAITDRDSHGIFLSPCAIGSSCQWESSPLERSPKVCPRSHSWGQSLPRHTAGCHFSYNQPKRGKFRKWDWGNHKDLTSA